MITTEKGFWHVCFTLHTLLFIAGSDDDHYKPCALSCLLRLAVVFLEEIWKTIQRNPQCRENTPQATPCAMVWKSLP